MESSEPAPLTRVFVFAIVAACGGGRGDAGSKVSPRARPADALASHASLRLIIVSDIEGVLEPCGCTSRPAGGLDRISAAIAAQRSTTIPTVVLVAGNLWEAKESRALSDLIRAQALTDALHEMDVDLVAPGPADIENLASRLQTWGRDDNTTIVRPGEEVIRSFGSTTIAVQVLHGSSDQRGSAIRTSASEGESQLRVTAFDATAPPLPASVMSDLVVWTGSGAAAPDIHTKGGQLWIRAGRHTEGLMIVDLWLPRASPAGWQILQDENSIRASAEQRGAWARYVRLDSSAPRDPTLRQLLETAFSRIGAQNVRLRTTVPVPKPGHAGYVGSDSCAACHTPAYRWWTTTAHGRAYETLVSRKRELDLECVPCHVTGFEQPGGSSLTQLEHFRGVGCESCHGPGSLHADNPQSRQIRRVPSPGTCMVCHDPDHSDSFSYANARARLLVPVHGLPPSAPPTAAGTSVHWQDRER